MTGPPPPSIGDFVPELLCLGVDAIIASIIFGVYKATKNTIKDIKVDSLASISNVQEALFVQSDCILTEFCRA